MSACIMVLVGVIIGVIFINTAINAYERFLLNRDRELMQKFECKVKGPVTTGDCYDCFNFEFTDEKRRFYDGSRVTCKRENATKEQDADVV